MHRVLSGQLLPKRHLNKVIIIIITLRNTVATVSGIRIGTDAKDDHFLSQSSSYLVLELATFKTFKLQLKSF